MKDPNDLFGAICDDCQQGIVAGVRSVIAEGNVPKQYCQRCYRERAARGLEFDPRTRQSIQAQRLRDLDVDPEGETRGSAA